MRLALVYGGIVVALDLAGVMACQVPAPSAVSPSPVAPSAAVAPSPVEPSPGAPSAPTAVAWVPAPATRTEPCTSQAGLPDAACTPGALNPDVTQATIGQTICTSGFSARVRPPTSFTT